MNKPRKASRGNARKIKTLRFRLYIKGGARSSKRALSRLKSICRQHFGDRFEIEIVDVLKDPDKAKRAAILDTPTLVKLSPAPSWRIVGDLSDDATILAKMMRRHLPGGG